MEEEKGMNRQYWVATKGIDMFGVAIQSEIGQKKKWVKYYPETIRTETIFHRKMKYIGVRIDGDLSKDSRLEEHPMCDLDFSKKQKEELILRCRLSEKYFEPILPEIPDSKYLLSNEDEPVTEPISALVPVLVSVGLDDLGED